MLITENLLLPPSLSWPLSAVVHNKTGGVILFIVNFLRYLNNEGLLRFNLSTGCWEYDRYLIERESMSGIEGVTHYLSRKLTRLEPQIQLALKIASCFGFIINVDSFLPALAGLDIEPEVVEDLVSNGFLLWQSPSHLSWPHDKVHQVSFMHSFHSCCFLTPN